MVGVGDTLLWEHPSGEASLCRPSLFFNQTDPARSFDPPYIPSPPNATVGELRRSAYVRFVTNTPCHKSVKTMINLNELSFNLLSRPPYSPDLAPSDHWLFADLIKCSRERNGSNEEVIAETEAYFESKDESFYKKASKS